MTITISVGLQGAPKVQPKLVKITTDSSLIGRSRDCDLTIGHPTLSRRHCRISLNAQGWWIEDLA